MLRATHAGVFLLVEGYDDARVYRRLIDGDRCQIVPSLNKDMALKTLATLQESSSDDVVAIVDKDFDELNGQLPKLPNLFFTDTHDLETMLLQSPALEKLMNEFATTEKLQLWGAKLRDLLLESGSSIGYLLWVSLQNNLNLDFKGIDFGKFVDGLIVDEMKLIQEVKNKSQQPGLNNKDLQQKMKAQKQESHDLWQVCRGHDLMDILSIALRKTLGTNQPNQVTLQILERSLRLAYEAVYFQTTQLYAALKDWELQNQPYQILYCQSSSARTLPNQ
jgi:Protein of unknown function (DUF4435)